MSWLGVLIFGVVSLAAFTVAVVVSGRAGARARTCGAATLLAGLVGTAWLRYHPALEVRLFDPASYAYVRPWWSIVFALAFLGCALPQLPERRKRLVVGSLAAFLFVTVTERGVAAARTSPAAFTGVPSTEWRTCRQSTGFSCGAAASATLLAQHGIEATEREMVARCLTNRFSGTDEIGVLKGLGEKLAGTPLTARLERVSARELDGGVLPALACTKLSLLIGHWIVILARDGELVTIADPLRADDLTTGGIRRVPLAHFEREYAGVLVYLAAR